MSGIAAGRGLYVEIISAYWVLEDQVDCRT